MIEMIGINKGYRNGIVETPALRSVSLTVGSGEFVSILGPSGSGKTALLNIAALLENPDSGKYLFRGVDLEGSRDAQLARLRNQYIGMVFETFCLVGDLTIADNIDVPLVYGRVPRRLRRKRTYDALQSVGLGSCANMYPSELSDEQKQRAAIARAIVIRPLVVFADEPTGRLCTGDGRKILELLKEINRQGIAIVVATHNSAIASVANRRVCLFDGRIDLVCEADHIFRADANERRFEIPQLHRQRDK